MWKSAKFALALVVEHDWSWLWRFYLWILGASWWRRFIFAFSLYFIALFSLRGVGIPVTMIQLGAAAFFLGLLMSIFAPRMLVEWFLPRNDPITFSIGLIRKEPIVVRDPQRVLKWTAWVLGTIIGSLLLQSFELWPYQIIFAVLLLAFLAVRLRKRWPEQSTRLGWSIPVVLAMIYVPPCLTLRYIETEVRKVDFRADRDCHQVQTAYGASGPEQPGEPLWLAAYPRFWWYSTHAAREVGVLELYQHEGRKAGFLTIGRQIPFLGWNATIIRVFTDKPQGTGPPKPASGS